MYEDLALTEAIYSFLLVSFYMLVVSGYKRAGLTLALFSLLLPAFVSAKYYMLFAAATYELFRESFLAYALLGGATFIVLFALFYKLGLCESSELFCAYMAFGAAALGSVFLLLLAASGGLALAFSAVHWAATAKLYTLASRAARSVEATPLVLSRVKSACLKNDVLGAIKELRELSSTLAHAGKEKHVKEEVDTLLEELEYYWGTGRYEEARKVLGRIVERAKIWEAML